MSQRIEELRPLYLSAEEAMGLLDLCIMSGAEFDRDAEGVLLKLSDLVRQHLAAVTEEACDLHHSLGEDPRHESNGVLQECLRSTDTALAALPAGEFVGAQTHSARYSAMRPCPATRFRTWTCMPRQ